MRQTSWRGLPAFADDVESNAATDFYACLARASKILVQEEVRGISEVSIADLSTRALT